MAEAMLTTWVHGTSMQTEYPNRLTSVRNIGPFARIEGSRGQNTWLHFPVPTPAAGPDEGLRVGAVLLSFRTRTPKPGCTRSPSMTGPRRRPISPTSI